MASLDSLIQEEHRLEDLLGRQDVAPAERAEFIAEAKACAEALVRDGKLFLVSAGAGVSAGSGANWVWVLTRGRDRRSGEETRRSRD
jgi:hypothetical protein